MRFGVVDGVCRQNRRGRILEREILGHLPQRRCIINRRQPFYGHRLRPHREHRHSLPKRRTGKFQNICLHVFGHLPVRRFALSAYICQEFLGAGIVMGEFPEKNQCPQDCLSFKDALFLFASWPLRTLSA